MSDNDGKEIVSSSFIIAVSSLCTAAVGVIKMKVVALILGPAGIGLIGFFQNLMAVITQVSSVGISNSGTREVARSITASEKDVQYLTRKSLFWLGLVLALLGGGGVLLIGSIYVSLVAESSLKIIEVLGLAAGVFFGVVAAPQGAILAGVRDIRSIAVVRIFSSLLSSFIGVGLIIFFKDGGIVPFVAAAPLVNFFFMWFFARKVKLGKEGFGRIKDFASNFMPLIKQGAGFMASGLFMAIGVLIVRIIYKDNIGVVELGFMQASWVVSATYLGLVFSSMGTNYFPKLSSLVGNRIKMQALINLQAEIAFLFAAPLIILMIGFSDLVISLLYTKDFAPAAEILAFQLVGDVLKLASWPLGFVLLASGMSKFYMYKGFVIVTVFVVSVYFLIPDTGFISVGLAYTAMYALNFIILIVVLALKFQFFYSLNVWGLFLYTVVSALALSMCSFYDWSAGVYIAAFLFVLALSYSVYRLNSIIDIVNRVKARLGMNYE